jgi:hypothetical protein
MMGEPDQMYRPDSDAADTFTELQKALLGTETLEQFLHELATRAARLVTDGVSCGMTMRSNGRPTSSARRGSPPTKRSPARPPSFARCPGTSANSRSSSPRTR